MNARDSGKRFTEPCSGSVGRSHAGALGWLKVTYGSSDYSARTTAQVCRLDVAL